MGKQNMKNVVVIGGGTGQSAMLRGLKQIKDIRIYTIVTVADDGGSTGRLREDLNLPAMGDIRNVMLALAEEENMLAELMNYRFDNNCGRMSNHNLGNIILSALTIQSGDFIKAIEDVSKVLRVKGKILPCTLNNVNLCAMTADGTEIIGQHNINICAKKIQEIYYDQHVSVYPKALEAINNADYIIIGLGSVFTSIMPNLIIDDIREALCNTKAEIIYYCNSMTEVGETDDYTLEQHIDAISWHIGKQVIDTVIYADDAIPEDVMERYREEGAIKVVPVEKEHSYKLIPYSLLDFSSGMVRHDPKKIKESFEAIMGGK